MNEFYSDNLEIVSQAIDEFWDEDQKQKQPLANLWKTCVRFLNGDQVDSPAYGNAADTAIYNRWKGSGMSRGRAYTSNKIAPVVRSIVSFMTRSRPTVECFSSDKSNKGKRQAKVAQRILDAKYDIDNEYKNARMAAYWGAVTGTAFRKDFLNFDKGETLYLPKFDELGNEIINPETGDVEIEARRAGDTDVAILPGFGMAFDWAYTDFDDVPWVIEGYFVPVEWARRIWDRDEPGFTGKAKEINKFGMEQWGSLSTLEELKYASPLRYGRVNQFFSKEKVLIREMYARPSDEFPKGRMIIKAGDTVVFDHDSKYFAEYSPQMWHPYSCFIYEQYLGRLLGAGLVEKIIPQQIRINEINRAILENANISAKTRILAAKDQITRGSWFGNEGAILEWNPVPGGNTPQPIPGTPLPTQFFNERQTLEREAVEIAGSNFAFQGQAPQGVTAAAGIEMILENANTQLSDTSNSWEKFWESALTKKLRLIRKFYNTPNLKLSDYLRTIDKDALEEDISGFLGEDISDGIVLQVEAGSTTPRSEKMKREFYMQMVDKGFFGPINEGSARAARARNWLLEKFGEEKVGLDENIDVEKAKWENDRIKQGLGPEPEDFDNHEIHYSCHTYDLRNPSFIEKSSPEIKQILKAHAQWHKEQMRLQMQPPPSGEQVQPGMEVPQGEMPPEEMQLPESPQMDSGIEQAPMAA